MIRKSVLVTVVSVLLCVAIGCANSEPRIVEVIKEVPVVVTATWTPVPTGTPTPTPTPVPPTSTPTPTPTPDKMPTPTPRPTAKPAATSTPTPVPTTTTPTPAATATPVPTPVSVEGSYEGSITNTTHGVSSSMTLELQQVQNSISGEVEIFPPLDGDGDITGRLQGNVLSFQLTLAANSITIQFDGTVQPSGDIQGIYSVSNGQQGIWNIKSVISEPIVSIPTPVPTSIPTPEIRIEGSGCCVAPVEILNGDSSPRSGDRTLFSYANIDGSNSSVRTFTITNNGNASLVLSGDPLIQVEGSNASEFTVTTNPTTPIAPGGSTTFQVTFATTVVGMRSAMVRIPNNDNDENPYTFAIQGEGRESTPPNDYAGPWVKSVSISPTKGTLGTEMTFSVTAEDPSGLNIAWFNYYMPWIIEYERNYSVKIPCRFSVDPPSGVGKTYYPKEGTCTTTLTPGEWSKVYRIPFGWFRNASLFIQDQFANDCNYTHLPYMSGNSIPADPPGNGYDRWKYPEGVWKWSPTLTAAADAIEMRPSPITCSYAGLTQEGVTGYSRPMGWPQGAEHNLVLPDLEVVWPP